MSADKGSIFNNALPSVPSIPVTWHPIQDFRKRLSNLPERVKDTLLTAKGEFGETSSRSAFSFRSTPLVSRLRAEYVRPTTVHVTDNGEVIYDGQDNDPLLSRRTDDGSTRAKQVIAVDSFSFIFNKDGELVKSPGAKHHVQSTSFQGSATRGHMIGNEAGSHFGPDVQFAIETFGPKFLESIDDPQLRAKVAQALLGAREVLANPRQHFGSLNNTRALSPDPFGRTQAFFDSIHQALGINRGNLVKFASGSRELGQ